MAKDWFWKDNARKAWQNFDPSKSYTPTQLDEIATGLLLEDRKETNELHDWLNPDQEAYRKKAEIYVSSGTPNDSISLKDSRAKTKNPGQTPMFWRTHPQGRKVNEGVGRQKATREAPIPTHKACSKCEVDKPLEDFYRSSSAKDGRSSRCKTCIDDAWRAKQRGDTATTMTQPKEPRGRATTNKRTKARGSGFYG